MCVVVGFAILVAGLSGCATGYHASGVKGGFSQTKVSEDTYQVQVTGNGYMLLPSQDAAPSPFDAVLIIRETDAVAKGILSDAARRTLAGLQ